MTIKETLSKVVHIGAGMVVGTVILLGLLYLGYWGGTRFFEKKDFVGQKYDTYKIYDSSVICQWEPAKNGWVCRVLPAEFKEAVKTIFNFDDMTKEGGTVLKGSRLDKHIREVSAVAGINPHLVKAVIKKESNFNPRAVSKKGCKGLMQLCDVPVSDPFNPISNLYAGVFRLRDLLDKYKGDEQLALAAYNAGVNSVDTKQALTRFPETRQYVTDVLRLKDQMRLEWNSAIVGEF